VTVSAEQLKQINAGGAWQHPSAPLRAGSEPGVDLVPAVKADNETRLEPVAAVNEAVDLVNQALADTRRDLRFMIDEASGRTVVQVVQPSTGEVVRQIPSEEMLAIASRLRNGAALASLGLSVWG
jgi:flagellar protein FlaG